MSEIPQKAVEAAANAHAFSTWPGDQSEATDEERQTEARRALEAALPHLSTRPSLPSPLVERLQAWAEAQEAERDGATLAETADYHQRKASDLLLAAQLLSEPDGLRGAAQIACQVVAPKDTAERIALRDLRNHAFKPAANLLSQPDTGEGECAEDWITCPRCDAEGEDQRSPGQADEDRRSNDA